jgi:hypothetical protein
MNKNINTVDPEEFLNEHGFDYRKANGELIMHCPLNGCDADSTGKEAHFYISQETGQYDCKKCDESGNLITLAEKLGVGKDNVIKRSKSKAPGKTSEDSGDDNKQGENYLPPSKVEKCHEGLPERITEYLINDRNISEELIEKYSIGYGEFNGSNYITFPIYDPDGNCLYMKLREDPESGAGKMMYQSGSATLFDWDTLETAEERIVICEGEIDKLTLESRGVQAVSSTHGAGTFKEEWVDNFSGLNEIYICFDKDEAGKDGAEKAAKMLVEQLDADVYIINLPDYLPDVGDVNDYVSEDRESIDALWSDYAQEYHDQNTKQRIADIASPEEKTDFSDWIEVIKDNFPHLSTSAEISASVLTQLLIKDISKPFPLVLIDVPSSGKTITINFFSGLDKLVYETDKFTPASFVSNAANKSEEQLEKIDMLPRIRYNMVLIRDLASIFSKRKEDLKESLGILTRILDGGGFQTDSGTHGGRGYSGDYLFMMLAASTPLKNRVWQIMGNLGSRLLFLRLRSPEKSEQELVTQLKEENYKAKQEKCQAKTTQLFQTLWSNNKNGIEWNKEKDSNNLLEKISKTAKLLSHLRGTINENESFSHQEEQTIIEKPDRINQLLYNLARGHAVLQGRRQINAQDLAVVFRVALDSARLSRSNTLRSLLRNDGYLTTNDAEVELGVSTPTAIKRLDDLVNLNIALEVTSGGENDPKKIKLCDQFDWFLSEQFSNFMQNPEWLNKNSFSDHFNS